MNYNKNTARRTYSEHLEKYVKVLIRGGISIRGFNISTYACFVAENKLNRCNIKKKTAPRFIISLH